MASYRKRKNGTWVVRWSEYDEDGKRLQPEKSGFPTKRAAQRWILERPDKLVADTSTDVQQLILKDPVYTEAMLLTYVSDEMQANFDALDHFVNQLREDPDFYSGCAQRGAVYFLQGMAMPYLKIGTSSSSVARRIASIKTMSPDHIRLVRVLPGGRKTEAWLHEVFTYARRHGEWFLPVHQLLGLVDETFDLDLRLYVD